MSDDVEVRIDLYPSSVTVEARRDRAVGRRVIVRAGTFRLRLSPGQAQQLSNDRQDAVDELDGMAQP